MTDPNLKSITFRYGSERDRKPNLFNIAFKFGDGRAAQPALFSISILWERTNSDMPPEQPKITNPLFSFSGM